MVSTSAELFDAVRTHYVRRLAEQVEAEQAAGRLLAAEHPFTNERGEIVAQRAGGFPFLGDIIARGESGAPEHRSVILQESITFKTVNFRHGGALPLKVHPFPWTAATVEMGGAEAIKFVAAIEAWAHRWYGLSDGFGEREAIAEEGLSGVIHRVQFLEERCAADRVVIDVDLGSAHVEALLTLLDAVKEAGASQVILGDPALAG